MYFTLYIEFVIVNVISDLTIQVEFESQFHIETDSVLILY